MIKQLISACALTIVTTCASATVITDAMIDVRDYATSGDRDLTYIGALGLEFLDYDLTRELSVSDALNRYSVEGFRQATIWDVLMLHDAFGVHRPSLGHYEEEMYVYGQGHQGEHIIPTINLLRTVGLFDSVTPTPRDGGQYLYNALMLTSASGGQFKYSQSDYYFAPLMHKRVTNHVSLWNSSNIFNYGALLVRGDEYHGQLLATRVPEPGTLCLIGAALGFAGLRMRRRSR